MLNKFVVCVCPYYSPLHLRMLSVVVVVASSSSSSSSTTSDMI